MGLFRRGTKLLRLDGGLRDCCCRPEQPEECFCPSLCRYYWDWGGDDYVAAGTLLNTCAQTEFGGLTCFSTEETIGGAPSPETPYGIINGNLSVIAAGVVSFQNSVFYANSFLQSTDFSYDFTFRGDANGYESVLVGRIANARVFVDPIAVYSTTIRLSAGPICPKAPSDTALWFVNALLAQVITIGSREIFGDEKTDGVAFYQALKFVTFTVPAVCVKNSNLWCCPPLPQFEKAGLHLSGPVEFEIDASGVTANGVSHAWAESFVSDLGIEEAEVEGYFPFDSTLTATIQLKDSCVPVSCDCNQSLTGKSVRFEGKTFVYGDGDEFVSDDGATRWIEDSPGLFYRYDYDPCDYSQQFVANQITANVFCTSVDGEEFWGVVLTNECFERSACGGAYDATRGVQWSGVFFCYEGEGPQGSPHSAADSSLPPAVVYDVSSDPAPTGTCAAAPAIPSFEFLP